MVVLDWEMPLLNGPELVRIVRSPGVFPTPDIPIIMLTGHGERWRIVEAIKLGVNEFLCKPVSAKALFDRMISILLKPRESVQVGSYYGPAPRKATIAAMLLPAGGAPAPTPRPDAVAIIRCCFDRAGGIDRPRTRPARSPAFRAARWATPRRSPSCA